MTKVYDLKERILLLNEVFSNKKSKSSRIVNSQIKDRIFAANDRIFLMNDRILSVKIVYFSNSMFPTDCYHSQFFMELRKS